jgi:glutathione S-transferase
MESRLRRADWLAGTSFSVADIVLYAYTHMSHQDGFKLAEYPAIGKWLDRVRVVPGHITIDKRC